MMMTSVQEVNVIEFYQNIVATTCKTASNMQYALAAVDQGDTIRSAALRFGVARSRGHQLLPNLVHPT